MPEIKRGFTSGKMNKDLDERLVPNGEYRHAMNVQVSSSDGDNVGSIQNILGNKNISQKVYDGSLRDVVLPAGSKCVGSISDEKNDMLYWFVTSPTVDFIFRRQVDGPLEVVFSDTNKDTLKFQDNIITGINIIDDLLFWTDNYGEPKKINITRCLENTNYTGHYDFSSAVSQTQLQLESGNIDIKEEHITVIKKPPTHALSLDLLTSRPVGNVQNYAINVAGPSTFYDFPVIYSGVIATRHDQSNALKDIHKLTLPDGTEDYNVNNFNGALIGAKYFVKIRTGINPETGAANLDLFELDWIKGTTGGGNSYANGSTTPWAGRKVVLKAFSSNGSIPPQPITSYKIKGVLTEAVNSNWRYLIQNPANIPGSSLGNLMVEFTVTDIDGEIPDINTGEDLNWVIDLFDESEKLFEFKFPRFSYRYKYEDNEYSSFAPFTEVAFVPGSFDYHPKKGYNIGMTNKLSSVILRDFVPKNIPEDVKEVDLLYKEEGQTTVYVVENIHKNSLKQFFNTTLQVDENHWDRNYYVVNDETINTVVPSNQSLRPYDNVPVKALAQEVTGNRIVYANYFQGHSIDTFISASETGPFYPSLSISISSDYSSSRHYKFNNSLQSIKSLREYQLGVLFIDKYGRETPILTTPQATFKVGKNQADKANRLDVTLNNTDSFLDENIKYFKFFIKETAGEYYNLAMDRWYDAGDGNRWLSFPSVDRNKIDIDTFLILKKAAASQQSVKDKARYKILAIENEAPDFIKTRKNLIESQVHTSADRIFNISPNTDGIPVQGENSLIFSYNKFSNSSGSDLHNVKEGELYIEFGKIGETERSNRYRITQITKTGESPNEQYNITLNIPLDDDVNFIADSSGTGIIDNSTVRFYHYTLENSAKFDGRFFVKVYSDDVFKANFELGETSITGAVSYRTIASKVQYSMHSNMHDTHGSAQTGLDEGSYNTTGSNTWDKFGAFAPYFREYGHKDSDYQWPKWAPTTAGDIGLLHSSSWGAPVNVGRYKFGPDSGKNTIDMGVKRVDNGPNGSYGSIKYKMPDWWREALHSTVCFNSRAQVNPSGSTPSIPSDRTDVYVYEATHTLADIPHPPNVAGPGWSSYDLARAGREIRPFADANKRMSSTEVWFIDSGPYVETVGGTSNLQWSNNQNIGTHSGISSLSGTTYNMNLSFGPINFEAQDPVPTPSGNTLFTASDNYNFIDGMETYTQPSYKWSRTFEYPGYNPSSDDNYNAANRNQSDFWNIGKEDNNAYGDTTTVRWVDQLSPGKQFKWKEDPLQNIHTINSLTTTNTFNYEEQGHGSNNDYSASKYGRFSRSPYALPVNFRRNWELNIKPNDDITWIPDTGSLGVIDSGFRIEINSEINSTTGLTYSNNTTGNLEDYSIYLEEISSTCLQTGLESVFVREGMIVTKYNNSSNLLSSSSGLSSSNPYLLVKEVKKIGSLVEVKLCGYSNVLSEAHCITPTDGQKITFQQPTTNGYSPNSAKRISLHKSNDESSDLLRAVGYTMQFVEVSEAEPGNILPENPAIWETEPKDESKLDIYHEISGYNAYEINTETVSTQIPVGSIVEIEDSNIFPGPGKSDWIDGESFAIVQSTSESWSGGAILIVDARTINIKGLHGSYNLRITRPDGSSFKVGCNFPFAPPSNLAQGATSLFGFQTTSPSQWEYMIPLFNRRATSFKLNWYNCYSFLNGVESNRVRDNFNLPFISNGVRVSTVFDEPIVQEHRKNGLIFSGIYNSTSGINETNQFIQAEKITKDVNPIYGSIQKLHSRDSDLIALCEDKVLKILANKDAVFNADGNPQLTANQNVLGQTIPFIGEYGISKDPASFASESYRAYFTDKVRGAVIRLSKDGLTAISDHGMKDWFRDNLKLTDHIIGSYDDKKDEYNVKLGSGQGDNHVVSFSELVKGWVSFKSFVDMESAISCANDYYTFKKGIAWQHHVEIPNDLTSKIDNYNTFYNVFKESELNFIFNESPGSIKSFKTLNYEGTKSRIIQLAPGSPKAYDSFGNVIPPPISGEWHDNLHYNEMPTDGWYCEEIQTNLEKGSVNEFINKENKYFNYIKGNAIVTDSVGTVLNSQEEIHGNMQGLGLPSQIVNVSVYGCMDPLAYNYDPAATIDAIDVNDNSGVSVCIASSAGCTDPTAWNYNALYNTDDGSCLYVGCMDNGVMSPARNNGQPWNGIQIGPYPVLDPFTLGTQGSNYILNDYSPYPGLSANNINTNADIPCGPNSNIPWFDNNGGSGIASVDINRCCTYDLIGCTDATALNYDTGANTPCNSDATAAGNNECCILPVLGCTDPNASNYDATANVDNSSCAYPGCIDPLAENYQIQQTIGISPVIDWSQVDYSNTVDVKGFIAALTGDPSAVDLPRVPGAPPQQPGPFGPNPGNYSLYGTRNSSTPGGSNYIQGCGWTFYPPIFGANGSAAPAAGTGVLIPMLRTVGTDSCDENEPLINHDNAVGAGVNSECDPTIPYQSLLLTDSEKTCPSIICGHQNPSYIDSNIPLANNKPNTPDGQGGYLNTWPDISYALDIKGNQIPFTHTWWDSLGNYNPLQYLVNPLPPCPTVDDGSCEYGGCMDPLAGNYNASATFSTGGCLYCGDSNAPNYDGAVDASLAPYLSGCLYCGESDTASITGSATTIPPTINANYIGYQQGYNFTSSPPKIELELYVPDDDPSNKILELSEFANTGKSAALKNIEVREAPSVSNPNPLWVPRALSYAGGNSWTNNTRKFVIQLGNETPYLNPSTDYEVKFKTECYATYDSSYDPNMAYYNKPTVLSPDYFNVFSNTNGTLGGAITTDSNDIPGCMDVIAVNYNPLATVSNPVDCSYTGCTISEDMAPGSPGYALGAAGEYGTSYKRAMMYEPNATQPHIGSVSNWESYYTNHMPSIPTSGYAYDTYTFPPHPTNASSGIGYIMNNDLYIQNVENATCQNWMRGWDGSSIFNWDNYWGCTDPAATNFVNPVNAAGKDNNGAVIDLTQYAGYEVCSFDGCHADSYYHPGDNPDINGYCADAVYERWYDGTPVPAGWSRGYTSTGTPPDAATGLCPGNGYLATNHDPKANLRGTQDTNSCLFSGCMDPVCGRGYFRAEYPNDGCVTSTSTVWGAGYFSDGIPALAGTSDTSAWNVGGANHTVSYGNGAGHTQKIQWAATAIDQGNKGRGFAHACYHGCSAACYDANGDADPNLVNTKNGYDLPPDYGLCLTQGPVSIVQANNTSDGSTYDFTGLWIEFEWNDGASWDGAGDSGYPSNGQFANKMVVPLDQFSFEVVYSSSGTEQGNIRAIVFNHNTIMKGPNGVGSGNMLATYAQNNSTVKWTAYKQCINGLKTQVSAHVGINALNYTSLHTYYFNGAGYWGN